MNVRLHHIGYVVKDILGAYESYKELGFAVKNGFEHPVEDPNQQVKVGAVESGALIIEFLEPLSDTSPVQYLYTKGGGIHHVCYQVPDINTALIEVKQSVNARQLTPVTVSVWDGAKVVFNLMRDNSVVEFIELKS